MPSRRRSAQTPSGVRHARPAPHRAARATAGCPQYCPASPPSSAHRPASRPATLLPAGMRSASSSCPRDCRMPILPCVTAFSSAHRPALIDRQLFPAGCAAPIELSAATAGCPLFGPASPFRARTSPSPHRPATLFQPDAQRLIAARATPAGCPYIALASPPSSAHRPASKAGTALSPQKAQRLIELPARLAGCPQYCPASPPSSAHRPASHRPATLLPAGCARFIELPARPQVDVRNLSPAITASRPGRCPGTRWLRVDKVRQRLIRIGRLNRRLIQDRPCLVRR